MVGKRASSSDDQLFFSMPDNAQAEQYQTFVFDGNTYNCIGAFDVPDRRKIPEADIIMETRKGVALSYAPEQVAV